MSRNSSLLDKIFIPEPSPSRDRYAPIGLQFNPFPKSGTANINGSDFYNGKLIPVNERVTNQLLDFIRDALNPNELDKKDRFISATITGDYGTGKTQLLLFVKCILGEVAAVHKGARNPYVIYIDNPGVKLPELVGSMISRIGEEDFKKFIWARVIGGIRLSDDHRRRLSKFQHNAGGLFRDANPDPYAEENTVSYKQFLNAFTSYMPSPKVRKEFEQHFREILTQVLQIEVGDSELAQYFYDLLSNDYGVNKTWEALSSGNIKPLDRKLVEVIRYVVHLIKDQGYTDFFILVDEFEDITRGRLSKTQVDNYVYNLRSLLDEHREWCLLFSMTGEALRRLQSVSPPLADRISARRISLEKLSDAEGVAIAVNYLNLARESESGELAPFDLTGLAKLNQFADGNARRFLRNCYLGVEKAVESTPDGGLIDADFVAKTISGGRA
jgi:hypothetical protein